MTNPTAIKVTAAKAKKILSVAAVLPIVNTKTKKVFLKVVKGNADKSIEATANALKNKKLESFEGAARTFVKEQGFDHLKVWTSRVAKVQPQRVIKSAINQIASWSRNGFEVINAEDFKIVMAEVAKVEEVAAQEVAVEAVAA